jgi:hypothetical protein
MDHAFILKPAYLSHFFAEINRQNLLLQGDMVTIHTQLGARLRTPVARPSILT